MKMRNLKECAENSWEWLCRTKNNKGLISLFTIISIVVTVGSLSDTDTDQYTEKEIEPRCVRTAISLSGTKNVKMEGNIFEGFDCAVHSTNSENLQMTGNVMR
jgi:hypothetical protein